MQKKSGRKRHSESDIAKKLAAAERLRGEGKTQAEIAKALGVTAMTYSRWRKSQSIMKPTRSQTPSSLNGLHSKNGHEIRQLKAENRMLRDVVLRMVLEREQLTSTGRDGAD